MQNYVPELRLHETKINLNQAHGWTISVFLWYIKCSHYDSPWTSQGESALEEPGGKITMVTEYRREREREREEETEACTTCTCALPDNALSMFLIFVC